MNSQLYNSGAAFDVIVVGGGHAGIEAAHAAAKLGSKTILLTLDATKIGVMSCNPAVGGVGKGHIVYEVSALGGLMPKLCTKTYLQARMLNTRKGPAVQGLRLQIDKFAYNALSCELLSQVPNLTIVQGSVERLLVDNTNTITGVQTADGKIFSAKAVVLTTGTFLNGVMHIGSERSEGGRIGENSVKGLTKSLQEIGVRMGRLKTGTPPRLLKSSLDFSKMEQQEASELKYLFEFTPHKVHNSHVCHITHTNEKTHAIIRDNIHLSARFSGAITGIGPRYCPSIEDKIVRFPDKTSHHVFVEPEGANSEEIYPNGLSTSLPAHVQTQYIQSIVGFENAVIVRPGYAIEYDFAFPEQLKHTLEVKAVPGLFHAGQINGTTGYEEAAGQGIIAGINAHQYSSGKSAFVLDRSESYIGVMIDDLVLLGVDEPYRMFTSRAERRLLLRQDNAFARLTHKAYELGMVDQECLDAVEAESAAVGQSLGLLRSHLRGKELLDIVTDDTCTKEKIVEKTGIELSDRGFITLVASLNYGPYLQREEKEVQKAEQYKELAIPVAFDYTDLPGLSKELQEKLKKHKPQNIAQAARIPGMTPAAISLLIFKTREFQGIL